MKSVVIVGVGAVGSLTASLLVKAGLAIKIIDRDYVDEANLERQVLYTRKDIGKPKAVVAEKVLDIKGIIADVNHKNIQLLKADLVLDCTDNFETRFLINDYCKKNSIPWIYAGAVGDRGTILNILPKQACFRCLFDRHQSIETCDTAGVLASVVKKTAQLQASQALKILRKQHPETAMLRLKGNSMLKLKVKKNPECEACNGNYEYLSGKKGSKIIKLCGTNSYQIKGKAVNLQLLLNKIKSSSKKINVKNFGYCLHLNNITIFQDGRAIVKASSPTQAKSTYHRVLG